MLFALLLLLGAGCGKKADDIDKKKSGLSIQDQNTSATEALLFAIDARSTVLARQAIKAGANLDALLPNGDTPLTLALKKNQSAMLRTLLEGNPDINKPNRANQYPIHIAVENKNRSNIFILLSRDVDLSVRNARLQSPLLLALETDDERTAIDFIKAGAALDREAMTELSFHPEFKTAARLVENIQSLLKQNLQNPNLQIKLDKSSARDFILSADEHFIDYLLKRHDLKQKGNGLNLLSTALELEDNWQRKKIVRLLLKRELNPNGESKDSEVPLIKAVKLRRVQEISMLLNDRFGADTNALDRDGRSALSYAVENLSVSLVKTLLSYDAKQTYAFPQEGESVEIDVCDYLPQRGWFGRLLNNSDDTKWKEISRLLSCF